MLGVAIRRIELTWGRRLLTIDADAASLVDGYHAFEVKDGIHWTDGDAAVPARLFADMQVSSLLTLQLGCATQYLDESAAVRAA